MLQSLLDMAESWGDFVVFPARLVVKAPRDIRLSLHDFGKTLHGLLVRQSGGVMTGEGSPIQQELEALFAELCLIREACKIHDFVEPGKYVEALLARRGGRFYEVAGELPAAFLDSPSYAFRPFVLTQLDHDDLKPIADLCTLLESLLTVEPDEVEMASALAFDLAWVQAVLKEHLAVRGTLASLDRQAAHLASLSDDLAGDLTLPIHLLNKAGDFQWT